MPLSSLRFLFRPEQVARHHFPKYFPAFPVRAIVELSFEFKIILLLIFFSTFWIFSTLYIIFIGLKLITSFQRKSIEAKELPFFKSLFSSNKNNKFLSILELIKKTSYLNDEDLYNYLNIQKKFKIYIGLSLVFSLVFYLGEEYASKMEFLIR